MGPELQPLNLLLELDDDRSKTRRREASLVSVVVHLVFVILLLLQPRIFEGVGEGAGPNREPRRIPESLTYLALPPDDQAVKSKPKTEVLSDKDRIAQEGAPEPVRMPPLPRTPPPAPQASAPQASTPSQPAEKPQPKPEPEKTQLAHNLPPPPLAPEGSGDSAFKLQLPKGEPTAPQLKLGDVQDPLLQVPQAGGTPGRSVAENLRSLARERASGGQAVSDLGGGGGLPQAPTPRSPAAVGEARILSDTQGVDFDPYLRRIVTDIRRNWYAVMPEIARLGRKGRVVVIFEVMKDGSVPKLTLAMGSGTEPLDRAALAGISASVPFPPLPPEFGGPMVRLQVTFLYNMMMQQR